MPQPTRQSTSTTVVSESLTRKHRNIMAVSMLIIFLTSLIHLSSQSLPKSNVPSAVYPDWAHDHWVWLASSQANQSNELQLVKDYLARDIPVGAVDIDSEWETGDNNFIWDTRKYPNASWMIEQFHHMGVRVICWVTSLVNNDTSNYQYGKDHMYFLSNGRTVKWWHGYGAFIDYDNPEGMKWWHAAMNKVIHMGLDGWKTDGTDPFIFELGIAWGHKGIVSQRDYANAYYRDFFYHTRNINPEALIMARPVDSLNNLLYWKFAPRDVVFSGWVGDQDPTFAGLRAALRNMFHSAWNNYVNFGSDIGGYRSGPGVLGRTKTLFIRWAQLGAFCPLMENGGQKEHRPWMFDNNNETLTIYRTFVHIHLELKPYLLTIGSNAYDNGGSAMIPMSEETLLITNYNYLLGPDIFVSPITEENSNQHFVQFPLGSDWVDWWNSSKIYRGGSNTTLQVPLSKFPVFHRKGSLLPLSVSSSYGDHGDASHRGHLTILIHPKFTLLEKVTVRQWKLPSVDIQYTYEAQSKKFQVLASPHSQSIILLLRGVECPSGVHNKLRHRDLPFHSAKDQLDTSSYGYYCDTTKNQLFIRTAPRDDEGIFIEIPSLRTVYDAN